MYSNYTIFTVNYELKDSYEFQLNEANKYEQLPPSYIHQRNRGICFSLVSKVLNHQSSHSKWKNKLPKYIFNLTRPPIEMVRRS